ncbi:hypothetical protein PTQ19_10310 [Microbacterium esteraromaticum]|uniref:hypothetical protein n=1 Tax=Microbacterium esteraromaticum TaxID=57043 RepID=UPI002367C840|nr:hypothetical protein [Microbacterium esteraromaticum]WDH77914.1 hypothetical protein PTQ19_10310 [Microbacterium esteraromaticum]
MVNETDRRATAAEKRKQALDLRRAGWGYQEIADEVGWANKGTAHTQVQKAIKEITRESATELLELELSRLDDMFAGLYEAARGGDNYSVDRALKIMDQRARLLGLYEKKPEDGAADVRAAVAGFVTTMASALRGDDYGQVTDDSSGTEHDSASEPGP